MKLAILGTGKIVHDALIALSYVPEITVCAIYARPHSLEKAQELARNYKIPEIYTDYAALLAQTKADYVYIGLVNSVHYTYAEQAILAGKHVIMEKPFTSTAQEAEKLAALAREHGRFILEAVTCLNGSIMDRMKELLPKIGPVRMVQSNYSQYSSRYDKYRAGIVEPCFDPELSGGALYDINIYNLNMTAELFGRPEEIRYFANIGFNGIDLSGTVVMTYPGFLAAATGAKDSDSPGFFLVQGEKGWIRIPQSPNALRSLEYEIEGEKGTFEPELPPHRMCEEFRRFAGIAEAQDSEKAAHILETSVTVLFIAEAARKSAGIRFGIDGEKEKA